MSESDAMNIAVSDITTVKVTKYTGDKELYNKYQRILCKFSSFLGLARKKRLTSVLCMSLLLLVNLWFPKSRRTFRRIKNGIPMKIYHSLRVLNNITAHLR
jgi:hypothetical protein